VHEEHARGELEVYPALCITLHSWTRSSRDCTWSRTTKTNENLSVGRSREEDPPPSRMSLYAISRFSRSSSSSRFVSLLFCSRPLARCHTRGFVSHARKCARTLCTIRFLDLDHLNSTRGDLPWREIRQPGTERSLTTSATMIKGDDDDDDGELFFLQRGLLRWLPRVNRLALRAALLPVGYSQGLGGGSYSFLLSFRAHAFFIPLTFLNALLIPLDRVSPANTAATVLRIQCAFLSRIIKFFAPPSRIQRRTVWRTVMIDRKAGERKASGSRHIRIVFQTRPSLPRSTLRLFLLVSRERVFPRFARRLPRPRRRTTRRSWGLLSSAQEIRVLLRFSRTRLSYRGLFLSSSSSFSFSPSPSRTVSLSFFTVLFPSASPFLSVCLLSLLRVVIPFAKLLAPGRGGEVKASALSIVNWGRERERETG